MNCRSVAGYDIDPELVDVCRMRLKEHGLESAVRLYCAPNLEDVKDRIGPVDLVLLSGVIEHIPLTERGLRRRLIRTLFGMLKPGGSLYIYDTPNRAWPIDFHTTGLLGIPWTKPGSPSAYARAVRAGRYGDSPRYTPGPRGMEQCGAWRAPSWSILRTLLPPRVSILNRRAAGAGPEGMNVWDPTSRQSKNSSADGTAAMPWSSHPGGSPSTSRSANGLRPATES